MKRKVFSLAVALCAGFALMTGAGARAETGITVKIPSCTSIGNAIKAAYGPITSVKDNTAAIHKLGGTTPYRVLRACDVHVPGRQIPLSVTIDGPLTRQFVDGMAKLASRMGEKARKLDGPSYGDDAYLLPQMGGGFAVNSMVGNTVLTVGAWASASETENMAEHIVRLMR